ncbi:MAG: hypothetical protein RL477_554 [Pseudomonadota bacterium]
MTLVHHYLQNSCARTPDKAYLVCGEDRASFAHIDRDSDALAAALQQAGVVRGDRVIAMLENSREMVVALWGVLKAGAVFVPLHHATKEDKLAFILADSEAAAILAPASIHERVLRAQASALATPKLVLWVGGLAPEGRSLGAVLAERDARPADPGLIDQDLCLIIYTSGSTGQPKGVMMTHRAIVNNVWSISTYLRNMPHDVVLCVLPLSFDYGLFQVLTAARVGFTVVLERSFAYPYEVLRRAAANGVTGIPGVPTIFATLLQLAPFDGIDLSSLRYVTNTAAAFPPAHIRRLRTLLPQTSIFSMFGLTECTRVAYLDPAKIDDKIQSVGRAMPNSETFIVDEAGNHLGPNEIGELVVRGTSLMRGYWRRPEETARALRDGPHGEKFLYTGDLFRADADGDLYFVGRRDDVFKCRGEKVSPREIENVLFEIDAVAEAVVVGVPDAIEGMAIKAYVVPREGRNVGETEVRRHCRERLEPRLVPKYIEVRGALPKTDSGKITKKTLRVTA